MNSMLLHTEVLYPTSRGVNLCCYSFYLVDCINDTYYADKQQNRAFTEK